MTPCPYCIGAERDAELDHYENRSLAARNATRQTVSLCGGEMSAWSRHVLRACALSELRRDVFPAEVGGRT